MELAGGALLTDAAAGDESGWDLDLSDEGTRLVIGSAFSSVNQNGDAANAGHARVFEYVEHPDNVWTQLGYAVNGTEANELSGYAVALSGDGTMMATGAPGAISGRGRLSVTQWDAAGNEWVAKGTAIVGVDVGDALGAAVEFASDGTRLAVGAPGMHDGAGATLVFEWKVDLGDWVSMRGNRAGEAPAAGAGAALGISGNGARVVVGTRGNDGAAELNTDAGHVRVYDWTAAPDGQNSPPPAPKPPPPGRPRRRRRPRRSRRRPRAAPAVAAAGRDVDADGRRRRRRACARSVRTAVSLSRDGFRLAVGGIGVAARVPVDVRRVGADERPEAARAYRTRTTDEVAQNKITSVSISPATARGSPSVSGTPTAPPADSRAACASMSGTGRPPKSSGRVGRRG